jgi:cell division protein FtsW
MIFAFLCMISIVEVYSASSALTMRTHYGQPFLRHVRFLAFGLGLILVVHAVPSRFFSIFGILLPAAWLLLICARLFGESVNGSYRWINLFDVVTFQPSELAKLCLISWTAFILSKMQQKAFWWIVIPATVTCGMIFIDNGSTGILLFIIIVLMMIIGQIPWKSILSLLGIAAAGVTLLVVLVLNTSPDFWKKIQFERPITWAERIKDFGKKENVHDPGFKIHDDIYQVSHAKIAIANGGLFGRLPGNSLERDLLPHAYSDFIYAIIIEETGILGGVALLLLYIILFIRAGLIANQTEKLFPKFLVMGIALILIMQALSNMAVAVGLIPVTGQTLPLVSRGGTSTLIICIYFGIILSVSRYDTPKGAQVEDEIVKKVSHEKEQANN